MSQVELESTKPIDGKINLDDPKDAKTFLRGVRIEGKEITEIQVKSGKTIKIEDMNDSQLVFYAKEVYFDFCGGVEGKGGFMELETKGMNQ